MKVMTETHNAAHWGVMVLWTATIVIALIGIVWLGIKESRKFRDNKQSAAEILKRRLAQGDIDEKEYQRILEVLYGPGRKD